MLTLILFSLTTLCKIHCYNVSHIYICTYIHTYGDIRKTIYWIMNNTRRPLCQFSASKPNKQQLNKPTTPILHTNTAIRDQTPNIPKDTIRYIHTYSCFVRCRRNKPKLLCFVVQHVPTITTAPRY